MKAIVVVSTRLTAGRRAALERLVRHEGRPEFVDLADARSWTDRTDVAAVVFDGPGASAGHSCVPLGARLVAIGCGLDGATPTQTEPSGEIFARVTSPEHPLTERVQPEFLLVDAFTPIAVTDESFVPVLSVGYRFVDRPVVVASGRAVVSGLGNTDEALEDPQLAAVLRRAMRPHRAPAARSLGVGVVGYGPYGGMGFIHGTAVSATSGLELVAVCDRDGGRRKAAEQDFAGVRAYMTVEELAADEAVDIAIVALPPVSHAEVALALLRAGKHVVLEKPLCLAVADADLMVGEASARGLVLTVHQSRRWDQDFRAVRRAVDDGLLGDVFNIETFVGGFEHPCRAWHSEDTVSGGAVYDWGSHHVDWILQLFGSTPSSVTAVGHKRVWHDVTNLDQLRVRMRWDDGREAEFLSSDVAAVRRPKFYVQGTQGTLVGHYRPVTFERLDPALGYVRETSHHAEAPVDLVVGRYQSGSGIAEMRLPLPPVQTFAFHRNVADHLLLGDPLAVTPESSRDVVAVLQAATHSASEGGLPVDVVPRPG
ncbi:MAG TPA: Gfo/Idh/MocA family oxidoreductase [Acidimicrobiales bacterium]|nr:Gfo/Idh/MocA family oxidoreductase [Acidimicrobiales bacterium]